MSLRRSMTTLFLCAACMAARSASAVPKALSSEVKKGLDWLSAHQLQNGAWGQGEEAATMGDSLDALKAKSSVADTCMAALALMRAGSTPAQGPHQKQVRRAIEFVMSEIEAADKDSLNVTNLHGTRVQMKIGPYVDTFMSSMLLAEAKGKMGDEDGEKRVAFALNKVLAKIEKNQRDNGTWDAQGWAPVLSQAMASKGLNRAKQAGVPVDENVRARAEKYASDQHDTKTGTFGGSGSAGVGLYSAAASSGALRDSVNTNDMEEAQLRETAKSAGDESVRAQANAQLQRYEATKEAQASAERSLVARLDDPSFVSGFGSNGGEEFLSYMLVSESLVVKGGKEWNEWDAAMTSNLKRVQNGDGSWTGHHCITGRTFVTSAALLVLTADRAPVPIAAKLRRG